MKTLQNYLNELANSKIAHSETKVEQKASRAIKEQITATLCDILARELSNENIVVLRTSNGVGIALDNEEVGFLPIEISATVKNLDYDIATEHDDYIDHLAEMKAKAEAKEKAKAEKIAKQKAIAEQKKKLQELRD